ncbi:MULTISPECIES: ParA family protein [unclassified Arthrobacter]|uniref:ParA family protein n=1 Tax=unclassified Arthrobacter TaxID=235627 RepID=UPI002DFA029A|nr:MULTISPECIES: ParA family protein [unclassified Arthrobacter]MEC5192305.1 chromosome partitioning protein [Arthrobacter sp. MP_M4]MEC5203794.1 chromosome partitioning protein [Arthrobacter sp. MP_M7]
MQVVSISSLKGGVGKTSVTTGLASAALSAGIRTLVVDLDPHADASTALGVRPGAQLDIGRMLKSPRRARLAENVVASGWVEREAAIGGTPAGSPAPVLDVAVGSAYTGIYDRPDLGRRDLRRLSSVLAGAGTYDLVLVDCPPSLNGLTRMAWSASDKVALVAEPALFSVAGTERTMRAIQLFKQEFAPRLSSAGIVANRVRTSSAEHTFRLAEMESMFGPLLLTPHIPEQANWQQIQGAAHAIHHWPGESARKAAVLFGSLLASLLGANGRVPAAPVRDRVNR